MTPPQREFKTLSEVFNERARLTRECGKPEEDGQLACETRFEGASGRLAEVCGGE